MLKAKKDKQRQEAQSAKERKKQQDFENACAKVFSTAEGRKVLKYLVEQSGYQSSNVVFDRTQSELRIHAMTYNEGRRDLYLALRQYIPKAVLRKVEI